MSNKGFVVSAPGEVSGVVRTWYAARVVSSLVAPGRAIPSVCEQPEMKGQATVPYRGPKAGVAPDRLVSQLAREFHPWEVGKVRASGGPDGAPPPEGRRHGQVGGSLRDVTLFEDPTMARSATKSQNAVPSDDLRAFTAQEIMERPSMSPRSLTRALNRGELESIGRRRRARRRRLAGR